MAAVVALLPAGSRSASCSGLIFRDDFELGGTNRWANSTDPPLATGTWTFSLDFSGTNRAFALELIQRTTGAVAGYLPGGTEDRVLVVGLDSGSTVSLNLEFKNPAALQPTLLASDPCDDTTVLCYDHNLRSWPP